MTSLNDSLFDWQKDYVNLKYEFLDDDEIEFLEQKHPLLERFTKQGCPTCENGSCGDCKYQLQLYKHYIRAGIGLNYQRLDWEDFHGDEKAMSLAKIYLGQHKDFVKGGMGLLYHGTWGTGKTLLTSLIAKELVKLGYSVYFATFTQMVDEFTRGWGSNEEKARFESKVVKSDIFFLDDIGKEFRTKNNLSEATFDHVMRQRALDNRPTFITTNMGIDELMDGYGGAIFSLLKERVIEHNMDGIDYREYARNRTLDEIKSGQVRKIL
jgi:DNA polymerase III delta prime subunit